MNLRYISFKIKALFAVLTSLFIVSHSLIINPVKAEEQFAADGLVTYKVESDGKTRVTHNISLENLYSTFYATAYTLSLENLDANNIRAEDNYGTEIPTTITKSDKKIDVRVTFSDAVVGKGKVRNFNIIYENSNFAVKTGEIWEVSIPKLEKPESFRNYKLILKIPKTFGLEAYISPAPSESADGDEAKEYVYYKNGLIQTGVTAGFGQFQVFSFNLSYHLENPLAVNSQTEIAIPPDTAYQKVYITKMDPAPDNVTIDADGNYLAKYKLKPRQRIDVSVNGNVQLFSGYRPYPAPTQEQLLENLKPTNYWQADDEEIREIAKGLNTPEDIYNYVSSKLKYDYTKVLPNTQRMGAKAALFSPDNVICMEFTDLFVALARAKGIPAREVNGYAYTENKALQPLSLVADVLHSWPEYYDEQKKVFVPVDPTWGSTSGIDYFNKLDLRHFTFVIHGVNDREPYPPGSYKLGPNPQKDVYVSFGKLPENKVGIPKITIKPQRSISILKMKYSAIIKNVGSATLYQFKPAVYYDNKFKFGELIAMLPPYATEVVNIEIPFSLLGQGVPDEIRVEAGEVREQVTTSKSQIVIVSMVILFAIFMAVLMFFLIKLKKHKFTEITGTIGHIYAKLKAKTFKNKNYP